MNVVRFIHKWVGVIIALVFFISCLSASVYLIGKISVVYSHAPLIGFMKRLHVSLFLGETGRLILGIATLLSIVEIITGYYLWWKIAAARIKTARKKGFSWFNGLCKSLNLSKPSNRVGWHITSGFWSGIPIIIIAATALTWSFGWFAKIFYAIFGANENMFHTIHAIHVGTWMGLWSRCLWLAIMILALIAVITGIIIFVKKYNGSQAS